MKHVKTKIVFSFAFISFLAVASTANATTVGGGTISFTGIVTDHTCKVEGGAGTDNGTDNFNVELDPVKDSDLTPGISLKRHDFNIVITGEDGGHCADGKVLYMSFRPGETVNGLTGNLRNMLSDESTNVEIQLLKKDGTPIDLRNEDSGKQSVTMANHIGILDYAAQYHSLGNVTPGLIETSIIYRVVYN